ncbi:hypothetical protein BH18ACT13_BH18ACT13_02060 [soil metagenome]
MAEPSWPVSVDLSSYLTDVQTAQVKLRVPAPVLILIADLIQRAPRRVGLRNASELVAALLVKALADDTDIGELVGDYRDTLTHAILETGDVEGAFLLPAREDVKLD